MGKSIRKIWQQPWGYAEGFLVALGVALVGLSLQVSLGNIHYLAFSYPVNAICGLLFVASIVLMWIFAKKRYVVRWLSGVRSTIPAIVVLLGAIVVMGLTPQHSEYSSKQELRHNFLAVLLGWDRMTTSWPFVLLSLYLLVILGFTLLNHTSKKQDWRVVGFYLNHVGLFLAFLGGILGSPDIRRLEMTVAEGGVEWRATDNFGHVAELPIAIELDTFMIEEYPPKLVIISNESGKILPENRPESYLFEGVGKTTALAGYTLEITDYLPHAGVVRDTAFVNFVPLLMDGATTAIKVRVWGGSLSKSVEGWVSNGSYMFPYNVLYIDENKSVAMPMQEVKRYTSKVTVFTESGGVEKAVVEVNKPLSIDGWAIYQLGYDETKGKYSDTSVFELVRDPWQKLVYAGIFMLFAGAIFLFVAGPKKRNV